MKAVIGLGLKAFNIQSGCGLTFFLKKGLSHVFSFWKCRFLALQWILFFCLSLITFAQVQAQSLPLEPGVNADKNSQSYWLVKTVDPLLNDSPGSKNTTSSGANFTKRSPVQSIQEAIQLPSSVQLIPLINEPKDASLSSRSARTKSVPFKKPRVVAYWNSLVFPPGMNPDPWIDRLQQNKSVSWIERDYSIEIALENAPGDPAQLVDERLEPIGSDYPPVDVFPVDETHRLANDFYLLNQWGFHNYGDLAGTEDADIDALEAWTIETGSRDVIVAITDTGIDFLHPDLKEQLWNNPGEIPFNGLDDDGNGWVDDWMGYDFMHMDSDPWDDNKHGTHVAGIIGARTNNRIGIAGVCWEVQLMSLKVFDKNGSGRISTALMGIDYAIQQGAHVMNASWGTPDRSLALQEIIQEATDAGMIFVAAAGNAGNDAFNYPAAFDGVISVAATDRRDRRASFSSYGETVDVSAPGKEIFSTLPNNQYGSLNGTSMAAPMVAGTAALLKSKNSKLDRLDIENILKNTAEPAVSPGNRPIGAGRINAFEALSIEGSLPLAELDPVSHVQGLQTLTGVAEGAAFERFIVEISSEDIPGSGWTELVRSETAAISGLLLKDWDTSTWDDGWYRLRLRVENSKGQSSSDEQRVRLSNFHLSDPLPNDVIRIGPETPLIGTTFGADFQLSTSAEQIISPVQFEYQLAETDPPGPWVSADIHWVDASEGALDSLLATWDTRTLEPNRFYNLRMRRSFENIDPQRAERIYEIPMLYLDSRLLEGYPVELPYAGKLAPEDWRFLNVADLDGDGSLEMIIVDSAGPSNERSAFLRAFSSAGELKWSYEMAGGAPFSDEPVIGDLDGDGRMEIFASAGGRHEIHGVAFDGTPLPGWPVEMPGEDYGKSVGDIDHDGRSELVVFGNQLDPDRDEKDLYLSILNLEGETIQSWKVKACVDPDRPLADLPAITPAIGNLDDDDELEIVSVWGCDRLAMFDWQSPNQPAWTAGVKGNLLSSPALGDLNQDGTLEIVISAYSKKKQVHGGVYAFDALGRPLAGWPILAEDSFFTQPGLGDLDQDGDLDVVVTSWDSDQIFAVDEFGFPLPGWPKGPFASGSFQTSPMLGDIDGDGTVDCAVAFRGNVQSLFKNDWTNLSEIRAWSGSGKIIPLIDHPTRTGLYYESISSKSAPPILTDLNGDGKMDLIATSFLEIIQIPNSWSSRYDLKQRGGIYAWNLDIDAGTVDHPWPMSHANAQRTSWFQTPIPEPVPPRLGAFPEYWISDSDSLLFLNLREYMLDPIPLSRIEWKAEAPEAIFVKIQPDGWATVGLAEGFESWEGEAEIKWTLRDQVADLESSVISNLVVQKDRTPPVAVEDSWVAKEDMLIRMFPLQNDYAGFAGRGPVEIDLFTEASHGKIIRDSADPTALVYFPYEDFNGEDRFIYQIRDQSGAVTWAVGSIWVEPIEDAPKPAPDRLTIQEDSSGEINPIENDLEPDGQGLTLVDFDQPENGVVIMTEQGNLRFTPPPNFSGIEQFAYRVADSNGNVESATVTVQVQATNDRPVSESLNVALNRNSKINVTFTSEDLDNDRLTFRVIDPPEHGELWVYPTIATYFPEPGFVGVDKFTYLASDGLEESGIAVVTITTLDQNNPPSTQPQKRITLINQAIQIQLGATDLDQDQLEFEITEMPQHGQLTGRANQWTYIPEPGFVGEDYFLFIARDPFENSEPTQVDILVTDENTAPEAQSSEIRVSINEATKIMLKASDRESTPIQFVLDSNPKNGQIEWGVESDELIYTPAPDYSGPDRFTFLASDGEMSSDPAVIQISVQRFNRAPQGFDQLVVAPWDRSTTFELNLLDLDGDPMEVPLLNGVQHGALSRSGSTFTYTPNPGFNGVDSLTYKPWDGIEYGDSATVNITVTTLDPDTTFPDIQEIKIDTRLQQVAILASVFPGKWFELQSSDDAELTEWKSVDIQQSNSEQVTLFDKAGREDDVQFTSSRFYRLLQWDQHPGRNR